MRYRSIRLLRAPHHNTSALRRYASETRNFDPLRILFCGSDLFSCASLSALHVLHKNNPEIVKSIDVVCRAPKPVGRGYKELRPREIDSLASELGLPVWRRDTFAGWDIPRPDNEDINLIIAVSFGLWIPSRLLSAAKYGGLNVHPSLLPQLRGAAPLQHTILQGLTRTGVTLQTLSTIDFDQGIRLLQLPESPGIWVAKDETPQSLLEKLGPIGAEALITGIRQGLHVAPYEDKGWTVPPPKPQPTPKKIRKTEAYHDLLEAERAASWGYVDRQTNLMLAPKINKNDQRIIWSKAWTAEQLLCQFRAFGGLFSKIRPSPSKLKLPEIPRYFNAEKIKSFISASVKQDIDWKACADLARNREFLLQKARLRDEKKLGIKQRVRQYEKMQRQLKMDETLSKDAIRKKLVEFWLGEVIAYHIPYSKNINSLIADSFVDVADLTAKPDEFIADWYRSAIGVLASYLQRISDQNKIVRVLFSEPEVLSPIEAAAVRSRFVGNDVGYPGGPKDNSTKMHIPIYPRTPAQWIDWADPVQLARNQADLGGPRFKEEKNERKKRKELGKEVPVVWDDNKVAGRVWGQAWLEEEYTNPARFYVRSLDGSCSDKKTVIPVGPDFVPREENMGAILLPATKGGGVVRIRTLKEEGKGWEPAAQVIKRYRQELRPHTFIGSYLGSIKMTLNGVMLFRNIGPREREAVPESPREKHRESKKDDTTLDEFAPSSLWQSFDLRISKEEMTTAISTPKKRTKYNGTEEEKRLRKIISKANRKKKMDKSRKANIRQIVT